MTLPVVSVLVFFGAEFSGGTSFVLDSATKGVLDNVTYLIAGSDGDGVEVATDGFGISIRRGRSRELDEFEAGTCSVSLHNFTRLYDALNTAGIYFGELVPGKRVIVKVWDTVIYSGVVNTWDLSWPVDGNASAVFQAEDCLATLGRIEFDAWTATPGQEPGARITDMIGRPEVGFGSNRDIGTGVSTLQGDNVTWGSQVLNYAQLVTKSDQGRLYASRDNLLTFRGRQSLVGASVAATFDDTGTNIPFATITTQVGSELLYNRVGVDREGGILQTVEDTASESAYGVRTLSLSGLLMDSDTQSLSMAEYLCHIYKDPTPRISSIALQVHNMTALQRTTVSALEIGQLVRVQWTPQGAGVAVDQTVVVEGVTHDVTPAEHYLTLSVAPSNQSAVFILDDAMWGTLDTGPGVLSF
jgi:hypothetical protein